MHQPIAVCPVEGLVLRDWNDIGNERPLQTPKACVLHNCGETPIPQAIMVQDHATPPLAQGCDLNPPITRSVPRFNGFVQMPCPENGTTAL
jgi:hypothetical protein